MKDELTTPSPVIPSGARNGPDIARVAALVGDPARAAMLTALLDHKALTASELGVEAGVGKATASAHLAKLLEAGLVSVRKQGRHRYHALADSDVAHLLETLMGVAARTGQTRVRTGPRDPAMRRARVCYDHLAGEMGVRLYDGLLARGVLRAGADRPELTEAGAAFCESFGVSVPALRQAKRPLCRDCLDWSLRRNHLAGALGAALLGRMMDLGWAARDPGTRVIRFTPAGEAAFAERFDA